MSDIDLSPVENMDALRIALIFKSYQRLTGKQLLAMPFSPQAMWNAPQAIVAHGTEEDPVFFYGNRAALELFEMTFEEFIRLPSRLSAESPGQEARAVLMNEVTRRGFVDNYSGMRISSLGHRFLIQQGTVWNLRDASGVYHGQAATFIV
jgi:hypothetical protein